VVVGGGITEIHGHTARTGEGETMGCLEWIFTVIELGIKGVVALGVILVVIGAIIAFGTGSYYEAGAVDQAGMGCSFGFFVGLGLLLLLWQVRRR
jgi:hypothetical protein